MANTGRIIWGTFWFLVIVAIFIVSVLGLTYLQKVVFSKDPGCDECGLNKNEKRLVEFISTMFWPAILGLLFLIGIILRTLTSTGAPHLYYFLFLLLLIALAIVSVGGIASLGKLQERIGSRPSKIESNDEPVQSALSNTTIPGCGSCGGLNEKERIIAWIAYGAIVVGLVTFFGYVFYALYKEWEVVKKPLKQSVSELRQDYRTARASFYR